MPCSTFIIRVDKEGNTKFIYKDGPYYRDFDDALRNAKTVHQSQGNPDSEGNVVITITLEH